MRIVLSSKIWHQRGLNIINSPNVFLFFNFCEDFSWLIPVLFLVDNFNILKLPHSLFPLILREDMILSVFRGFPKE